MFYYYPGKKFAAVSVTGGECEVRCSHCEGKYVRGMLCARTDDELISVCGRLKKDGCSGVLVSGGCDVKGRVPLPFDALKIVREMGLILNVHTGLVDEDSVGFLRKLNPYISFEVPTPSRLQLSSLKVTQEDYFASLSLMEGLRVVPHVMVGLKKSEELMVVKKLREMGFSSLVLIVFTPTKGTSLEKRQVNVKDVIEVFENARSTFARLVLGCMRPRLKAVEEKAFLFDGVVLPTAWAREKVASLGIPVEIRETCCVVE